MQYPYIKDAIDALTSEDREIAQHIMNEKTGRLRATKPTAGGSEAQYVWRMVAFYVSPKSQHHCMPVMADLMLGHDKGLKYSETKELRKKLDAIVDQIVNAVPKEQWHGVHTWGRALYG